MFFSKAQSSEKPLHDQELPTFQPQFPVPDPFAPRKRPAASFFDALLATALFRCWPLLIFFGLWSTAVALISDNVRDLSISSTLLTVIGTVLGFVISYRTTSSFERYNEGRRLWSQIILASRNFARTTWIHVPDALGVEGMSKEEQKARSLVEKKTIINLVEAFGVAVKHYLRGEDGIYYQDLYHLVKFLPPYALPAGIPSTQDLPTSLDDHESTSGDILGRIRSRGSREQGNGLGGLGGGGGRLDPGRPSFASRSSRESAAAAARRAGLGMGMGMGMEVISGSDTECHGVRIPVSSSAPHLPLSSPQTPMTSTPPHSLSTPQTVNAMVMESSVSAEGVILAASPAAAGGPLPTPQAAQRSRPPPLPLKKSSSVYIRQPPAHQAFPPIPVPMPGPVSPPTSPRYPHSTRTRTSAHRRGAKSSYGPPGTTGPSVQGQGPGAYADAYGDQELNEDDLLPASLPPRYHILDLFPLSLFVRYWTKKGNMELKGRKAARLRARMSVKRKGGGVSGDDGAEETGNLPLEVSFYLSSYISTLQQRKTADVPTINTLLLALNLLVDGLTGLERILTTPIPFSYSIHLWVVTVMYCFLLPFQIWTPLRWLSIPATVLASFIFFGFLVAGEEIENPFGYDKNDLNLDHFTNNIIRNELRAITSHAPPDPSVWAFVPDNNALFNADTSSGGVGVCSPHGGGGVCAGHRERVTPAEWVKRGSEEIMKALRV